MKFRVPGFPDRYLYDNEETEEYPYPPAGLIYSAAGVLKPFVIVNHKWKKHTLLHDLILPMPVIPPPGPPGPVPKPNN